LLYAKPKKKEKKEVMDVKNVYVITTICIHPIPNTVTNLFVHITRPNYFPNTFQPKGRKVTKERP